MEKVNFIRHFFHKDRISSDSPDIFWPKPDSGEFYQDVISYSFLDDGKYTSYTMGKHLFPKNNDMTVSMQRWMVLFIADGVMYCGAQALETGDFIVIPPACSIGVLAKGDNLKFYWCTTNDDHHINYLTRSGYREKEIIFGHVDDVQTVAEFFEDTIYRFPKRCDSRMIIVGRISCILSFTPLDLVKAQKITDQLFKRCLNIIDGKNGNVTVDKLAKTCFVSRRYLYTLFKEYKNISPVEYILSARMKNADKFLTSTDYSISKIAELVGYSNYSHFTRAYTKYFSISPTQRRKQVRVDSYMDEPPTSDKKSLTLDD